MAKKSKEEWKIRDNVFDSFTVRNVNFLENQGYFDHILSALFVGKEANVFLAETKEQDHVVVKIYRLENCNFNKMYQYLMSDPRFPSIKPRRREIIFAWVLREYRNLLVARQKGCRVPIAIFNKHNILIEEFIGEASLDENEKLRINPAPQLKDAIFETDEEVEECYFEVLRQIKILKDKAKLIHADLSEFNILYHNKKPVLIDFSQATSTDDLAAKDYLARDLKNIARFFYKIGVDTENIEEDLKKIKI